MDERAQRLDNAFFGPWRALMAAFGQHVQGLALIQMQAGSAYTSIGWRQFSALTAPFIDGSRMTDPIHEQAAAGQAWRYQLKHDIQRVLAAHGDLLSTAGALASDSLVAIPSVAAETARRSRG